jgi:uncharacterized YigZ family protein
MRILAASARVELVVQRSRFLALAEPVADAEAARLRLKEAKTAYVDATHVVHAFRCGLEGSETLGCSDDGEPPGTAGRPVLEVLKGAGGGDCLILVVRRFGGTKLGTGGLVKAYSESAKAVIAAAQWQERREWWTVSIAADWSEAQTLHREVLEAEGMVEGETFDQGVILRVRVPAERFDRLQQRTVDLTRGRRRWTRDEGM